MCPFLYVVIESVLILNCLMANFAFLKSQKLSPFLFAFLRKLCTFTLFVFQLFFLFTITYSYVLIHDYFNLIPPVRISLNPIITDILAVLTCFHY